MLRLLYLLAIACAATGQSGCWEDLSCDNKGDYRCVGDHVEVCNGSEWSVSFDCRDFGDATCNDRGDPWRAWASCEFPTTDCDPTDSTTETVDGGWLVCVEKTPSFCFEGDPHPRPLLYPCGAGTTCEVDKYGSAAGQCTEAGDAGLP